MTFSIPRAIAPLFSVVFASLASVVAAPSLAQDIVGFDRSSFGQVVLSQTQSAFPNVQLEAAVGNYNNESIRNYSAESIFARMGRSVGRLDILTDAGIFPCTAFIVDNKHLLTNHHCVPGILDNAQAGATRIEAVQFVAGYTQQGVEEGTQRYTVLPVPVESYRDLDYSVLEVIGDPAATFGTLDLTANTAQGGDPYWIIGHPMGEAQRISREKCKANDPAVSNARLLHTCDTLPGNSGSPVIDASLQKVVALHHAGSKKDAVNFAVPMGLILERSDVLIAAGPVAPPPPPPGKKQTDVVADNGAVCDALYAEAKSYNACFAYEAYAAQCAGHPYFGFAQGYIGANCAAAPPEPPKPEGPVANYDPNALPWCGNASRLNATEYTICSYPHLAAYDGQMVAIYGQAKARHGDLGQRSWLSNQRNACGNDPVCIEQAYQSRIAYLTTKAATQPNPGSNSGHYAERPGNYRLPDYQCFITVASRQTIPEAIQFIQSTLADQSQVRMFRSDNGYYAITYAVVSKSEADWRLQQWKSQGAIPYDSFCSSGRRYRAEISWRGGDALTPSQPSGGYTMYVDNNSDGGLNVRRGPSTGYDDYREIRPGTQLTVLKTSGNWSNVRLPDGDVGWVYSPLLTSSKPYVQQCWGQVVKLRPRSQYNASTGAGFLSVRTKPNTKTGTKISELYLGDQVEVLARSNGWARVKCTSGWCESPFWGQARATGWSSMKYLSISCN